MRARVALPIGIGAGLVLYAAEGALALGVAWGVVLAGGVAGAATAKWLPRAWYGRQLLAGLRAGVLASALAALGAVAGLLAGAPRDAALLLNGSSLVAPLSGMLRPLGALGWGALLLAPVLAILPATLVSALVTQVTAWSKQTRVLRQLQQAHEAAQPLARADAWMAAPATGSLATYPPAAAFAMTWPSPALPPMSSFGAPAPTSAFATHAPVSGFGAQAPVSGFGAQAPSSMPPAAPAQPPATPTPPRTSNRRATPSSTAQDAPPPAAPAASTRPPSDARPTDGQLTPEMRDALATWARENGMDTPPKRAPKESAFLNTKAPRRSRKKQDTQDWLC